MAIKLEIDDLEYLLDEIGSFVEGRIAPACQRPEHPISHAVFEQLTQEALELGILPSGSAETGIALWETCTTPESVALSTGMLRLVASCCPGLAFAWHRLALANHVMRRVGADLADNSLLGEILVPVGHYGLGRSSLAKWLSCELIGEDDRTLLADWLDRDNHMTVMVARENWESVIWPVWTDGMVGWQWIERNKMRVDRLDPQHGFDELRAFRISADMASGTVYRLDLDTARVLFRSVLVLDMLGQMAIGAGALDHGFSLAMEYASLRRQGGSVIRQHPAVKQLLADIETDLSETGLALQAFASEVEAIDLARVAAARKHVHHALCHAANQVVQVHGGSGYMRDTGPEKILRDINMLRLETGGLREIDLFLDGLREAGA